MAKHKLTEYLDYPLDTVLEDYGAITTKVIHDETGIPLWQLRELSELGYIVDGKVTREGRLILKTMMYCLSNKRFIKSAVGKISYRDRAVMFESIKTGHNQLVKWIYSRVYNLKDSKHKVIVKDIYEEVCQHFPSLIEQGYKGFKDIRKYIKSAARSYYLKRENKI